MKKMNWYIIAGIVVLIIGAALVGFGIFKNKSQENVAPEKPVVTYEDKDTLIAEYTKSRTGTDGYDGYTKTVLTRLADGTCVIEIIDEYGPDNYVNRVSYKADAKVIDEVLSLIKKYKMSSWNKHSYNYAPDGGRVSLIFRNNDGSYTTVSTDNSPQYGQDEMSEVDILIRSYIEDENKID